MLKIETLEALHNVRVHAFPTYPKAGMRTLRFNNTLVAVDERGRVYSSGVTGRPRSLGLLRLGTRANLACALGRLGVVGAGVDAELKARAELAQRQDNARWALGEADRLGTLGVPYTESQLRKLRAAAGLAP